MPADLSRPHVVPGGWRNGAEMSVSRSSNVGWERVSERPFLPGVRTVGPEQVEDTAGCLRDVRPWSEDGGDAVLEEEVVVLGRDHAADDDDDVARAGRLELLHQLRNERLVSGCLRRDTDHV